MYGYYQQTCPSLTFYCFPIQTYDVPHTSYFLPVQLPGQPDIFERIEQKSQSSQNLPEEMQRNSQNNISEDERDRDDRFDNTRRQVTGRNIHSNVFRSYLKFMTSEKFYKQHFSKVIERYGLELNEQDFYIWVKKMSASFKNYVKKKQIVKFLEGCMKAHNSQPQKVVARIMANYYFREVHVLTTFHSKKIQRESRRLHLQGIRTIRGTLQRIKKPLSGVRK